MLPTVVVNAFLVPRGKALVFTFGHCNYTRVGLENAALPDCLIITVSHKYVSKGLGRIVKPQLSNQVIPAKSDGKNVQATATIPAEGFLPFLSFAAALAPWSPQARPGQRAATACAAPRAGRAGPSKTALPCLVLVVEPRERRGGAPRLFFVTWCKARASLRREQRAHSACAAQRSAEGQEGRPTRLLRVFSRMAQPPCWGQMLLPLLYYLSLFPGRVFAFNLDTGNVIKWRGDPGSLFGFSLTMHRQLEPQDRRL